jgi:hypothetical protein
VRQVLKATLLGRGDFARQWHEHFASADELKLAIADADLSSFLRDTAPPDSDETAGAEVHGKLITGPLAELR